MTPLTARCAPEAEVLVLKVAPVARPRWGVSTAFRMAEVVR